MDRRRFLKWGSFLTVSIATGGIAGCGGDDDDHGSNGGPQPEPPPNAGANFRFLHGVASGDPRADSVVLWTRIDGDNGGQPVPVRIQVSAQADFAALLVDNTVQALPDWDYTVRNKVMGLAAGTTYYYRFLLGDRASPTGRTRTAPLPGTPVASLRFAFLSCQDWGINHWAGMEELAAQELDFIVHTGDYIYETVSGGTNPVGLVEPQHPALVLPDGEAQADGAIHAVSLADYRYLYRTYRSDPRLQALHASAPMIAIWDDHEFSNDCWQDRETYEPSDDQTPNTARRRFANQAWFEFMPADVTLDANDPSFQNIRIYRDFTFGDLATLVLTDERLYRADHVLPETGTDSAIGSRFLVRQAELADAEARKIAAAGGALTPVSMLGDAQRAWWQDRMGSATTTWKLWGNQVSLLRMQLDGLQAFSELVARLVVTIYPSLSSVRDQISAALVTDLGTARNNGSYPNVSYDALKAVLSQAGVDVSRFDAVIKPQLDSRLPNASLLERYIANADQWDGYDAERRALMAFLRDYGIRNVVALTGDIHSFFAGVVMDDYDGATPTPVMVDLVTAGLSSNSFQNAFKQVVDSDPRFADAKALVYEEVNGVLMNTLNRTLERFNPWLAHTDTSVQGYSVVTLTPERLSCTFHVMKELEGGNTPAQPATARTVTVEVPAGAAAVNVIDG
ncbi:alkaline phosphatase [Cupriavidus sp. AU9028]|uniref:alkaline phosphatase D family protein n=1 Tax=Cupriavidus sp. AU9028 TaxID=2871157 RepID=UPI001C97B9A9|nr:alkaline phosphatase D family protein [Cupriavidus sp. AU9028]MBY4899238.1 alkaline phosphatase D family protein [Cupriavidus sp. AU9028]